ncbi:sec-independent protein translocase protein TatB [Kribbella voronezhensis]|uniref:Sec-independent protein translocase protein TatB n=1 Tax=Kribbella voronezhensis TaxID=2512212 RepID=A0A4R7TJ55_9ACTN|nr:sec-independent translocase [Kribbella voronezhensis]TDU91567.1 sec-independent protein translocase protein TatB [Kribbella voronezhensis]
MLFDIGPLEIVVIAIVAILVFGPDRLPEFIRTAGNLLRQVRRMVTNAQNDLRNELGPEFADLDVRDLNPRSFVRKHLLEGIDDDDFDKPVSSSMDLMDTPQRLPAGQRAPYDPEST